MQIQAFLPNKMVAEMYAPYAFLTSLFYCRISTSQEILSPIKAEPETGSDTSDFWKDILDFIFPSPERTCPCLKLIFDGSGFLGDTRAPGSPLMDIDRYLKTSTSEYSSTNVSMQVIQNEEDSSMNEHNVDMSLDNYDPNETPKSK